MIHLQISITKCEILNFSLPNLYLYNKNNNNDDDDELIMVIYVQDLLILILCFFNLITYLAQKLRKLS